MRNISIESFRVIAIFFVVIIHIYPYKGSTFGELLNQASRFAVPLFFMISGYFFYQNNSRKLNEIINNTQKTTYKLIFLYLAWYLIYNTWPLYSPDNWAEIKSQGLFEATSIWWDTYSSQFKSRPMAYIAAGGNAYHLWFLPSLAMGIIILSVFMRLNQFCFGFMFACALFIVALLIAPYKFLDSSFSTLTINPRNGPFFSTFFVFLGAYIKRSNLKLSTLNSLLLTMIGLISSFAEYLTIKNLTPPPFHPDFYLATIPFATGIFFLALSLIDFGKQISMNKLGKYTLGIYSSHVLLMWLLSSAGLNMEGTIFKVVFCFVLSTGLSMLLYKHPLSRKLIS